MDGVELTDAAESAAQEEPQRSQTTSRGRGRGGFAGRGGLARRRGAASARRGKGFRRARKYEDNKVQASWERMQELKQTYSSVAGTVKPVLEEIADRSIRALETDPKAHQQAADYTKVKSGIDRQYKKVMQQETKRVKRNLVNLTQDTAAQRNMSKRVFEVRPVLPIMP